MASAVNSSAANGAGTLPDDLGEVTPAIESLLVVDVGWGCLAIETIEVAHLIVVKQLGDNRGDVVSRATSGNVLAVSSAVSGAMKLLAVK